MLLPFQDKKPAVDATVYIAEGAKIIGDVTVGKHSSVWFNTVIRGDIHYIRIGERTNIQDLSVLHVTRDVYPLIVGDDVTVGHNVILHGCTIGSRCLIGMGAVVMDGAEVGDDCIIGAGALVTGQTIIPPRSMVFGSPAKVKRELTGEELQRVRDAAAHYVGDAQIYRNARGQ